MRLKSFSTDFEKKGRMSNCIKIRPMGAELFHVDGRAGGHDEANARFSQRAKE